MDPTEYDRFPVRERGYIIGPGLQELDLFFGWGGDVQDAPAATALLTVDWEGVFWQSRNGLDWAEGIDASLNGKVNVITGTSIAI
jgi:hypothetical protein